MIYSVAQYTLQAFIETGTCSYDDTKYLPFIFKLQDCIDSTLSTLCVPTLVFRVTVRQFNVRLHAGATILFVIDKFGSDTILLFVSEPDTQDIVATVQE